MAIVKLRSTVWTETEGRPRRSVLTGILALFASLVVFAPTSATAAGAPPAAPVLVAPLNGATQVPANSNLRVNVSDPEGDALDVRFYARQRGATVGTPNPAEDFTFLVLPDTQNYVNSVANRAIMGQQTQWVVNNRAALDIAFVSHLGDIVNGADSATEWQFASQYMSTLDAAAVPNSVVPGNHDMDVATGVATNYRTYFPVSRYAQASWNSPTASYGGYLGQNLFGPDPIDRGNMDNFALLTAGGMDFLIISLEFNPPDYAIDWAKKVLAAYPERRAILVTHQWLDTDGQLGNSVTRPGGNTPAQVWSKLIAPSCSIFMIVGGHNHDGDLSEARRTDLNSCGRPVQQLLSDYQERANGGNGWLRYYTFHPSTNQISAVTYSPSLNMYETDADSAFTLPYDMNIQTPAPFVQVGSTTAASGTTASVVPSGIAAGTTYDWYATVNDGTSTTTGATWSFSTAAAAPTVLASDNFGRSVTSAWGNADVGGVWSLAGGAARFSVAGGTGVQTVPTGLTTSAALNAVSSSASDTTVRFSMDAMPNGPVYTTVTGRRVAANEYAARAKVLVGGAVELHVMRNGTALAGGVLSGVTLAAGQQLQVRIQVEGTSPTTIRAKAWKVGTTEPVAWRVTTTDATSGFQAPGGVALTTYLSSSTTNGPLVIRFDDLQVNPLGAPPPPNVPPTAAFTSTAADLALSVNGSGSTDSDGTITSYSWTFGDGAVASGITASHTYALAGTYPVTLTVTDDDSATDSETTSVTVTAPPGPVVLGSDSFGRTVTGGWGNANVGGSYSLSGGNTRFSVTNGAGIQVVPTGVTTVATLAGASSSAADMTVRFALDAIPNGPVYALVAGRRIGSSDYAARVKILPGGALEFHITRNGTAIAGGAVSGMTLTGGEQMQVRLQVQGTSPTTVRARLWEVATTEPTTWRVTTTDSTAGLQAAGGVALGAYLSSSATNGPLTIRFDDLVVTRLG